MSHKILIAGRHVNIINLNIDELQGDADTIVVATTADEAEQLLDDSFDAVIIGSGLPKETRLGIYGLILEKTTHAAVFCNAKDLGAEGLKDILKLVLDSLNKS